MKISIILVGDYEDRYTYCVLPVGTDHDAAIKKLTELAEAFNKDLRYYSEQRRAAQERFGCNKTVEELTGKQFKDRGGKFPAGIDPKRDFPDQWKQRIEADEYNSKLRDEASILIAEARKVADQEVAHIIERIKELHPFMYEKHGSLSYYAPTDFEHSTTTLFNI